MARIAMALLLGIGLAAGGCGGDSKEGCPGKTCTNCSGSGDCAITCPSGQVQYCGHFGYFSDPDLRCAYCAAP